MVQLKKQNHIQDQWNRIVHLTQEGVISSPGKKETKDKHESDKI